jgi:hypothetical protein
MSTIELKTKIASCNILFAFKGKLHKMLTANNNIRKRLLVFKG